MINIDDLSVSKYRLWEAQNRSEVPEPELYELFGRIIATNEAQARLIDDEIRSRLSKIIHFYEMTESLKLPKAQKRMPKVKLHRVEKEILFYGFIGYESNNLTRFQQAIVAIGLNYED